MVQLQEIEAKYAKGKDRSTYENVEYMQSPATGPVHAIEVGRKLMDMDLPSPSDPIEIRKTPETSAMRSTSMRAERKAPLHECSKEPNRLMQYLSLDRSDKKSSPRTFCATQELWATPQVLGESFAMSADKADQPQALLTGETIGLGNGPVLLIECADAAAGTSHHLTTAESGAGRPAVVGSV